MQQTIHCWTSSSQLFVFRFRTKGHRWDLLRCRTDKSRSRTCRRNADCKRSTSILMEIELFNLRRRLSIMALVGLDGPVGDVIGTDFAVEGLTRRDCGAGRIVIVLVVDCSLLFDRHVKSTSLPTKERERQDSFDETKIIVIIHLAICQQTY
jgi:hypothetical protein